MQHRASPTPLYLASLAVLALLGVEMWLSDFITLQGERTIYTLACEGGEWRGRVCTGQLAAGPRYRFRALRTHHEVLFWTVGGKQASGRFTACDITDGRNWRCEPGPGAQDTVTLEMRHGFAVHDRMRRVQDFHATTKLRWLLLHWGWPAGRNADD